MPLDEADKTEIAEIVAGLLNASNAETAKRYASTEAVAKMFKQGFEESIGALDIGGQITTALAGLKPPEGKADAQPDASKSPEFLRLQEALDKQEGQIREQTEAREAAEATSRQQRLDSAIRDGLSANNVLADRHPQAMAYLKTLKTKKGKPVLDTSDSGELIFRHQKAGYVDEVTIKDGLGLWTTTPDGKHYLPASGVNGDGQGAGSAGALNPSAIKATRGADGRLDTAPLHQRIRDSLKSATIRG